MSIIVFCITHWKYISVPQFRKSKSKMFKSNGDTAQSSKKCKKKKYSFFLIYFNCFPAHFLHGITNHMLHPRNCVSNTRTTIWYNSGWMTLLRKKWLLCHTLPRVQFAMTPDWGIYWYTPCSGMPFKGTQTGQRKRHIGTLWNSTGANTKSSPKKEAPGHRTGWVCREGSQYIFLPNTYITKSRSETAFLQ